MPGFVSNGPAPGTKRTCADIEVAAFHNACPPQCAAAAAS